MRQSKKPIKADAFTCYEADSKSERLELPEFQKKEVRMEGLKEQRKKAELTQRQVADKLGISIKAYQHYEYGTREPKLKILKRMAELFRCHIEELIEPIKSKGNNVLSPEFEYLKVEDLTGKELAVITCDEITTANGIVVRLKPFPV